MQTGDVIKWNDSRGFGFIAPDDGSRDIFIHISSLPKQEGRLHVGDRLQFEVGSNGKGPVAVRATRLNS
jgi:CspA family cold shock protein